MTLIQPHSPTAPWRTYRILRGEQGVFHYEPYKSALLPLWRFRTPPIARQSSTALYNKYLEYEEQDDFVGMDMCRKFLQMGMTRSARYKNWRGGRKYDGAGGVKRKEEDGEGEWEGRREKEEAGMVFREVWERVKGREGYERAKGEFLERQKEWDRQERHRKVDGTRTGKDGEGGGVQADGGRNSKRRRLNVGEGGDDEEKKLLRGGIQDGDDVDNGSGQEEGKRRSKRRKRK